MLPRLHIFPHSNAQEIFDIIKPVFKAGEKGELFCEDCDSFMVSYNKKINIQMYQKKGFHLRRILTNHSTQSVISTDTSIDNLKRMCREIQESTHNNRDWTINNIKCESFYPSLEFQLDYLHQYIDITKEAVDYAKTKNVKDIHLWATAKVQKVEIFNSQGQFIQDTRPWFNFYVTVFVEKNNEINTGSAVFSSRTDTFVKPQPIIVTSRLPYDNELNIKSLVDEAIRLATLDTRNAPRYGSFPVVLKSGSCGVLIHESVGHGLEGDFNRQGTSAFSGLLGQKVASEKVTVIDDGTIVNARGSINFDDEGVPGQKNILIENGILKKYMNDIKNGELMGLGSTGNGRREDFTFCPYPRMTNTFLANGTHKAQDLCSMIDTGILVEGISGGQVDITCGDFVFYTKEAYWIENGRVQFPLKNITLVGNGPEVMKNIIEVGDDFKLENSGFCGKEGQLIPVSDGQPSVLVQSMIISKI